MYNKETAAELEKKKHAKLAELIWPWASPDSEVRKQQH